MNDNVGQLMYIGTIETVIGKIFYRSVLNFIKLQSVSCAHQYIEYMYVYVWLHIVQYCECIIEGSEGKWIACMHTCTTCKKSIITVISEVERLKVLSHGLSC